MGCVSSKTIKQDLFLFVNSNNNISNNDDFLSHVVSLTSSTYGALKLDQDSIVFPPQPMIDNTATTCSLKQEVEETIRYQLPEVINTWELMNDLQEEKEIHVSINSNDKLRKGASLESPRQSISSSRKRGRRSLGPLFDPELIEFYEKELSLEAEERIKKIRKTTTCPPGGEHCVVIYTTTLRGIRKTFEDCNVVRSVMESYHIRVIERDISMDSQYKEELRKLTGTKGVKLPTVFVKGRLIGGANEVAKLEEEGQLEGMLQGISKAVYGCEGCGGIRFVMCGDCNGSCKLLDQNHNTMVKCGACNENGLVYCPLCSCLPDCKIQQSRLIIVCRL